jgi:hypothetical protein
MSTGSVPTWKRFDTDPPYAAFLQQAAGQSVLPLTTASQVELIAHNTGASTTINGVATQVTIRGVMTIASAVQGYVSYAWGSSDLAVADAYNAEYEISWQNGTSRTVPNDSYDTFYVIADLENG